MLYLLRLVTLFFTGEGLFYQSYHPGKYSHHGLSQAEVNKIKSAKGSDLADRFLEQYNKIMDPNNGYFGAGGVPYHSVETLMVEAPDYGHESTSEAVSYYIWLTAAYGGMTGDFEPFKTAWSVNEKYLIPSEDCQPDLSGYPPNKPAQYAQEEDTPCKYPVSFDNSASVGQDPLNNELKSEYGSNRMFATHWLLDVDNIYGFGPFESCTASVTNVFVNSYQRGSNESVWRTIPQPQWELFNYGEVSPDRCGYLTLFESQNCQGAEQWKYTGAPDADARTIQATWWANYYAKLNGSDISTETDYAKKLGDYLRYAQYDKYFKKYPCYSKSCETIQQTSNPIDTNTSFFLINWYYAWGGSANNEGWAWKIGSSDMHQGYQNVFAAWALSNQEEFISSTPNGQKQWSMTVDRNIEFWRWLQSNDGAIGGGCSNSWGGQYQDPRNDGITGYFYGMPYSWEPVYHDPPSNNWMGMQAWSMERLGTYIYVNQLTSGDAYDIMHDWVQWVYTWSDHIIQSDNTYLVPSNIAWKGQPDTWVDSNSYTGNPNLRATVPTPPDDSWTQDVGVGSELAHALTWWAATTGDDKARQIARDLLDAIYMFADDLGIGCNETRDDYTGNEWGQGFNEPVFVPSGWDGYMPNDDHIQAGGCPNTNTNFTSIRSWYRNDPMWPTIQKALDTNTPPVLIYHRTWAQSGFAIANWDYARLFPDD